MIPSETSREMIRAVAKSQGSDSAMKSPKEDILSAPWGATSISANSQGVRNDIPRARAYAHARGVNVSLRSSTPYTFFSVSSNSSPTAAPAGDTCLNEAAAGRLSASLSSLTSAYEFSASKRLIYPGDPHKTTSTQHVELANIRPIKLTNTFERKGTFRHERLRRFLMRVRPISQ